MKTHLLSLTLGAVFVATCSLAVESWPAFRGPNCSGVSDSAKPPVKIGPDAGVLWKIELPGAPSSPCVWGDRMFLTVFADGKLETRCFARRDGKTLWSRVAPAEKIEEFHATEGSPAASTPATDGRRVVSYFGSCGLVAYDFAGQELWRHALPVAQSSGAFGTGGSPLFVGNLVIVSRDEITGCALLAVDARTGKKVWETARPDVNAGFGTPITWKNNGVNEIVMPGSLKLKGYDAKTGRERWSLAGLPSFTCTTPVIGGGVLLFAGWTPGKGDGPMPSWANMVEKYDKNGDGAITPDEVKGTDFESFFRAQDLNRDGRITKEDNDRMRELMAKGENVAVAVKPGAQGELTESHLAWKQTRGLPYVPSPLYYQGRVYLLKDGGMVSSLDARTGQFLYTQERLNAPGSYYASPVAAEGRIYVASITGKVTVFKAGGDKPEILHQADFAERVASTPALVGNQLYLRTASRLYAFGM
jgi:outer membrane protein assembly factor BamB